jgi:ABC-type antimicrobial peptide transport system permease subunit
MYANIMGVDPTALEAFGYKTAEGRLLTEEDTTALLFGSNTPYDFYNPRASSNNMGGKGGYVYFGGPMGEGQERPEPEVDVMNDKLVMTFDMSYGEKKQPNAPGQSQQTKAPKIYKIDGVGLLKEGNPERDYYAFMNIDELKKLIKENNNNQNGQGKVYGGMVSTANQLSYQRAMVKVNDMKNVEKVQAQIKEMGFEAYSLTDYLKSMQKTSATLQMVLGGIGAISFLVAALGITNTMVMSIYERTREIGIMKVIGASLSDIRRIFLFESGMIGFIGGVTGLGLSKLASFILNSLSLNLMGYMGPMGEKNRISIIPMWLALSVIVFSTIVGLISGFYPARRAMKLSAIEAIKTE